MSTQTEKSLVFLCMRSILGIIFIKHGIAKLGDGYQSWANFIKSKNINEIFAIASIIAEILIGFLLILGIYTRITALIGFIFMLIAVFIAHDKDPLIGEKGISYQILIIFILLSLTITGSGDYAIRKD